MKTQNTVFQQTRYRKIFVGIFGAFNPAYRKEATLLKRRKVKRGVCWWSLALSESRNLRQRCGAVQCGAVRCGEAVPLRAAVQERRSPGEGDTALGHVALETALLLGSCLRQPRTLSNQAIFLSPSFFSPQRVSAIYISLTVTACLKLRIFTT